MRKKRCEKQLTLHFTGDNARIVDAVKEMAAYDFRTPEQEVIYLLATHGRMIPRLHMPEPAPVKDETDDIPGPCHEVIDDDMDEDGKGML